MWVKFLVFSTQVKTNYTGLTRQRPWAHHREGGGESPIWDSLLQPTWVVRGTAFGQCLHLCHQRQTGSTQPTLECGQLCITHPFRLTVSTQHGLHMKDPKEGAEGNPMRTNMAGPSHRDRSPSESPPGYEHSARRKPLLPVFVESSLAAQTSVRKEGYM